MAVVTTRSCTYQDSAAGPAIACCSGCETQPAEGGDDIDQTLSTYYRRRASEYDEVYDKPERQDDIARLAAVVRDFAASRRVLEVAAGTGYWTAPASETAASILATDLAQETLDIAQHRSYRSPVEFAPCDAFNLDKVPGSFDGGLACFWLSHVARSDMERFARHLVARLEPGSRVMFADNRYVEGSNWPITRTDPDGNTYQRRRLRTGETFDVLKNFPTADELRSLGKAVGTAAEVTELTYYWALTFKTAD